MDKAGWYPTLVYMATSKIYNSGMKNFHDFYFGMTNQQRDVFVKRVGTSIGYAERMALGYALPSLRCATRMVRAAPKDVSYESIVRNYEDRSGLRCE